jgi:hypothetical protein
VKPVHQWSRMHAYHSIFQLVSPRYDAHHMSRGNVWYIWQILSLRIVLLLSDKNKQWRRVMVRMHEKVHLIATITSVIADVCIMLVWTSIVEVQDWQEMRHQPESFAWPSWVKDVTIPPICEKATSMIRGLVGWDCWFHHTKWIDWSLHGENWESWDRWGVEGTTFIEGGKLLHGKFCYHENWKWSSLVAQRARDIFECSFNCIGEIWT